jgi:hypothetical protein
MGNIKEIKLCEFISQMSKVAAFLLARNKFGRSTLGGSTGANIGFLYA